MYDDLTAVHPQKAAMRPLVQAWWKGALCGVTDARAGRAGSTLEHRGREHRP